MLLTSLILVLREVLEAAVLVSLLWVLCQHLQQSRSWLPWALLAGSALAVLYSHYLETITDWQDGVGQELLNAALEGVVVTGLIWLAVLSPGPHRSPQRSWMVVSLLVVVAALAQELGEVLIYLQSALLSDAWRSSILAGASMGMGIGFSLGALLYVALTALSPGRQWSVLFVLLAFAVASRASQMLALLMQADWLDSGLPLWNSNALLSERSLGGEMLYALIGYEATPTTLQLLAYLLSLGLIAGLYVLRLRSVGRRA